MNAKSFMPTIFLIHVVIPSNDKSQSIIYMYCFWFFPI